VHVLNEVDTLRQDFIDGLVAANRELVKQVPETAAVMAAWAPTAGRVAIVSGGGSGHYPMLAGMVGRGGFTAVAIGEIFASPSSEQIYRATRAVDGGAGVLYLHWNYGGDVMHFRSAAKRVVSEGTEVETVLVTDDLASAAPDAVEDRRGIAGGYFVFKIAGAAAESGGSLAEVSEIARRANDMTRSMGVAFAGCTLPGTPEPLFTVPPGVMEVGLGIHGEPGVETSEHRPARELAELLVSRLLTETPAGAGRRVAVLLNGLGSTSYEELYVLYGAVHQALEAAGLSIHDVVVGETTTSLDMAGCSLSLVWLDGELAGLYDAELATPAFRHPRR
jgi:dihydroxyacetone kinase